MFETVITLTLDYLLLDWWGEIQSMEETTQGDLSAMVIYTIAIIPLMSMLAKEASQVDNTTKTTACANDLTGAGSIVRLRNWWYTYADRTLNLVICLKEANRGYL